MKSVLKIVSWPLAAVQLFVGLIVIGIVFGVPRAIFTWLARGASQHVYYPIARAKRWCRSEPLWQPQDALLGITDPRVHTATVPPPHVVEEFRQRHAEAVVRGNAIIDARCGELRSLSREDFEDVQTALYHDRNAIRIEAP